MVTGTALVTVMGDDRYFDGARICIRTLLSRTDLDVFVGCDDPQRLNLPVSRRLRVRRIDAGSVMGRPDPFLAKFRTLSAALAESQPDVLMLIDVDAVVCQRLTAAELDGLLGERDFAMAEQPGITGSTMGRAEFLEHYVTHSLTCIDPGAVPPLVDDFRYFNSGVVIARAAPLAELTEFAHGRIDDGSISHVLGVHMVSDQDYFQYWVNNRNPGSCAELSTDWNHCEWWDADFPRTGARIIHFSNFCNGPEATGLERMRAIAERRGLTAIVVTHESAASLSECITSMREAGIDRVVLFDNASTDESVEIGSSLGCVVTSSDENLGFAAGMDEASWLVDTDLLCIVNPDVHLDSETVGSARRLVGAARLRCAVPDLVDSAGHVVRGIQRGYTRRKIVIDVLDNNRGHARYLQWVKRTPGFHAWTWRWPVGACLFLRTTDFAATGGFDSSYFMYMEDVDFGRRWRTRGGRLVSTGTTVVHETSTGSNVTIQRRIDLLNAARLQFARRHYGRVTSRIAAWAAREGAAG